LKVKEFGKGKDEVPTWAGETSARRTQRFAEKRKARGTVTQRSQRPEHRVHREEQRIDWKKRSAAGEDELAGGAGVSGEMVRRGGAKGRRPREAC